MAPSSIRLDAGLWALCATALALGAVLTAPHVLGGGDLYWHIAAGRWMIENQAVLRIDPFSYTFQGQTWETRNWLSQLLLALAYVGAGWSGVLALTAAAASSGAGLLAFFLARGRRDALTLIWLALAFVVGAGTIAALPYLLALPCMVAWVGALLRSDGKPSLKLLPVMLIWANLSSSFVIGLGVTFVLALDAIIAARGERLAAARRWAVFSGFALVMSLITPTGVFGLAHALREYGAMHPVTSVLPLLVAIPAAAMLVSAGRWMRLVLLAGLAGLALQFPAGCLVLAVAAPLLAAGDVDAEPAGINKRALTALIAVALIGFTVRLVIPVERPDDASSPGAALANVPVPLKRMAVLNDVAFGGYLITHDVRPFIDTRLIYPAAFRSRYAALGNRAVLTNTLTRYHVRWTIFAPSHPAVKALDTMPGWHRLYADQWAVVHVRNGR